MSTLDINKIITSLGSTKIKDRNDGLNLLETLFNARFKLTTKQIKSMISAIFDLIQHEVHVYTSNLSAPVESRLANASQYLKFFIEKSIDDKNIQLTYKSYYRSIDSIMALFFVHSHTILEPVAMSFLSTLVRILSQESFKLHLKVVEWNRILDFLKRVIRHLLHEKYPTKGVSTEKLLVQSFEALSSLLQCSNSISISFLQALDPANYGDLSSLIEDTIPHYKTDISLIVSITKIINKLIVVLSTQDIYFVHKLVQLSIKNIFLTFYSTPWSSLQIQLLIFINLSATHNCMSLKSLPTNHDILIDEEDESIRSSNNKESASFEVNLYSVKTLIENLMSRINSTDYKFDSEDFGLIHSLGHEITWFEISNFYLKSDNFKPWLLILGIGKLIASYFVLKSHSASKMVSSYKTQDVLGSLAGSILDSSNARKRQKLDYVSDSLHHSHNPLEFCNRLILNDSNIKIKQVGLQLVVFLLESGQISPNQENPTKTFANNTSNANIDETTFDIPIETAQFRKVFDLNILFKSILGSFEQTELHIWSLYACKSIIKFGSRCGSNHIRTKHYSQLLKIASQLLKRKDLSQISCTLIYDIIWCHSPSTIGNLIDKSILTQLDNLIDLCEINGPSTICNESFQLWYSIHKVITAINSNKKHVLSSRIQSWMISKWDISYNSASDLIFSNSGLPNFIAWLCGVPVEADSISSVCHGLYSGPLNEAYYFQDVFKSLGDFIVLKEPTQLPTQSVSVYIDSLNDNEQTEELLLKLLDSLKSYNQHGLDPQISLQWSILIQRISHRLKDKTSLKQIATSLDYQSTATLESFRDVILPPESKSKILCLLNQLSLENLDTDTKSALAENFPFEKFLFIEEKQVSESPPALAFGDFDGEFKQTNQSLSTSSSSSEAAHNTQYQLIYTSVPCVESVKLVILYDLLRNIEFSVTLSSLVVYFEKLNNNLVGFLHAMYYLITYMEENNADIDAIPHFTLSIIVRLIGERLLPTHQFERSELTIMTVSKLLALLLPSFARFDTNFKKDCYDMCIWLVQCGEQNLLLTQSSLLEYTKFLASFISSNEQTTINNIHLYDLLLNSFYMAPNVVKVEMAHSKSLTTLTSSVKSSKQLVLYKQFFEKFTRLGTSMEESAAFMNFFGILSKSSTQILIASLFNVLELTKYDILLPYLSTTLNKYCEVVEVSSTKKLFNCFKFEILRFWWKFEDIEVFPYELFGYDDIKTFFNYNYKELIAVSLSLNHTAKNKQSIAFLKKISVSKDSTPESLVNDSLPQIIAMAYTKEGIRNEVFNVLQSIGGFKQEIKSKISVIVLEIIKFTEISKETEMRSLFYHSNISNLLIESSSVQLERVSDTSISVNSSHDLLVKLIEKYSDPESFWSTNQVYFLIRRISLSITSFLNDRSCINSLRKIKFILLFGEEKALSDFNVIQLTMKLLCRLIPQTFLHQDIILILRVFVIDNFSRYDARRFVPLMITLLSTLLKSKEQFVLPSEILENIKSLISTLAPHRAIYQLLFSANEILSLSKTSMSTDLIEGLLNNEDELSICKSGDDISEVINLISQVFPFLKDNTNSVKQNSSNLVRIFLGTQNYLNQSKEFSYWVANYLGAFYLEGGLKEENNDLVTSKSEFNLDYVSSEASTEKDLTTVNNTLDSIITYLSHSDDSIVACAETILGVLVHNANINDRKAMKYLDLSDVSSRFSSYILPLDFHTCVLLNDEDSESEIGLFGDTIDGILERFDEDLISGNFEIWSSRLFLSLIKDLSAITSIAPLFSSFIVKVPGFAKKALPNFICFYVSTQSRERSVDIVGNLVMKYCKLRKEHLNNAFAELDKLLIDTIILIRMQAMKEVRRFVQIMQLVDLECVYKVASRNKLYHTAIMLFEDWKFNFSGKPKSVQNSVASDERIPTRSSFNQNVGEAKVTMDSDDFEELSSIYKSIDDDDLIYGLPTRTTLDYALSLINRGDDNSLLTYNSGLFDSSISLGKNKGAKNDKILSSMLKNGFMGVSKLINSNEERGDDNYEWAWKLNCWELPVPREALNDNEVIYKTLKSIHDYPNKSESVCKNMILETLHNKGRLVNINLSSKEFKNNTIDWIKTLASIISIKSIVALAAEDKAANKHSNTTGHLLTNLVNSFNYQTRWFEDSDIKMSENILVARQVLFQLLNEQQDLFNSRDKWLAIINELSRVNNITRACKETQKMINSTVLLDEISNMLVKEESDELLCRNVVNLSKYHAACSLWQQGQTGIPVLMLKDIVCIDQKDSRSLQEIQWDGINLPISNLNIHASFINSKLVGWMADSRQDLASNIMENYVLPTSKMVNKLDNFDQQATIYQALANFCETQYKSRSLNEEISKLEKRVNDKSQEIDELKSHYGKTSVPRDEKKVVQRFYVKLKHQLKIESADLKLVRSSKEGFLYKAVEFYLKSISISDSNDENLDKFFSLWLEHSNEEDLNELINEDVLNLPSYKLISWCMQLISRLSSETSKFQVLLQKLIVNLSIKHPYHTLYQLMSLRIHENHSHQNTNPIIVSKYMAANKLWQELANVGERIQGKGDGKTFSEELKAIEEFCMESIKLAEYKVSKGRSLALDKLNIGEYWLEKLPNIPPPTKTLPIDHTTKYLNVPRLEATDNKVTIASSGISLPKIASFKLSDGSQHKILLKHGTDDLRQDSIMEQVFEKVNHIFDKDKESRKRRLKIRMYKPVPLGPQSGIIEFVPNSVALIDIVRPYHTKYDEMKLDKARQLMKEVQSGDKIERIKAYEQISASIHPVLHLFMFENFVTPDAWFQGKTAYTHGVATNSMVGHILGLGDRHCNNILLDKNSGEPIHIDLGVAFDQGKRLPIPETVPFRLTRDLVDGFGVSGVAGVFKKSCEHTFRVLRGNKDHIISILDVLRWDPLYSWALSPIRKKKLQDETAGGWANLQPQEDGSEAGRAVSMVSDKLIAGGLSVEAAVRELIQEATSSTNLAMIYFGWCPFF